jgi:hypothetical protein
MFARREALAGKGFAASAAPTGGEVIALHWQGVALHA